MKIDFDGLDLLEERLNDIQGRMENPRELLEFLQGEMSNSIEQTFNAEGRPSAWPKRTTGGGWPVLDKTGRLRDSAASMIDGGDSIARLDITPAESTLEMGTTVSYGKYHQHPEHLAHLDRGIMPIRRFLLFFENELKAWHERARRFFWWGKM